MMHGRKNIKKKNSIMLGKIVLQHKLLNLVR